MTKEQVIRSLVVFFDFTEEEAEKQFNEFQSGRSSKDGDFPSTLPVLIATIG